MRIRIEPALLKKYLKNPIRAAQLLVQCPEIILWPRCLQLLLLMLKYCLVGHCLVVHCVISVPKEIRSKVSRVTSKGVDTGHLMDYDSCPKLTRKNFTPDLSQYLSPGH